MFAQGPTTATNIAQNDAHWRAVRLMLSHEDPTSTALLANESWGASFRTAGYLLPAFHTYAAGEGTGDAYGWLYSAYGGRSDYRLPRPPAQPELDLPPGTHKVIALDQEVAEKFGKGQEPRPVTLADGSTVYISQSEGSDIAALVLRQDRLWAVYNQAAGR